MLREHDLDKGRVTKMISQKRSIKRRYQLSELLLAEAGQSQE